MISIPLVFGAFMAGLTGSPHCVVMCGPFASACTCPRSGLGAWHAGRLLGYAMLGAAAGGLGSIVAGPSWLSPLLAAALLCWFAAALAGLVPEPRVRLPGFHRAGNLLAAGRPARARFAFGVVNGFLPCGLVYSALSIPIALAHPVAGALAMLAFGAGTLPALSVAALGARRLSPRTLAGRRLLAGAVLAAGLWSIAVRARGDHVYLHAHAVQAQPARP